MTTDKLTAKNQEFWDGEVEAGHHYTQPWLDLDAMELRKCVDGLADPGHRLYNHCHPRNIFEDVEDKKVLCLASGGGQQSAVLGLLGAEVTVLDFCEGQLHGDQIAAAHYGYPVETVLADMRDLSIFADNTFDRVCQGISLSFVPDVREVYREVHRVLKPDGLYHVGHVNPSTDYTTFEGPNSGWDGVAYRIAEPYRAGPILLKDGVESMTEGEPTGEFIHGFGDIFNGLCELGFHIEGVWEHTAGDLDAEPGSREHMRAFVMQYFTIVARRL